MNATPDEVVQQIETEQLYGTVITSLPKRRRTRPTGSLLTVEQAAELLGMSPKWLYRNYH